MTVPTGIELPAAELRALLERHRARFVLDVPVMNDEPQPESAAVAATRLPLLGAGAATPLKLEGNVYRADTRSVRLEVPRSAATSLRITDAGSGLSAEVQLEGVGGAGGGAVEGYVVYPRALASSDVLRRILVDGVEDLVAFEAAPQRAVVTYAATLSPQVAGVRLVANTVELLDAGGVPRLRMAPPTLVDARQQVVEATVSVLGCAVDTNPAAPWDRGVTAPGARRCEVRIDWSKAALQYPALLDPAWTTTGNLITPRREHTATLLGGDTVLMAGGRSPVTLLKSAELYRLSGGVGTFAATGAMAVPRYRHAAATLAKGVLVAGGIGAAIGPFKFGGYLASAEIYNPGAGTWGSAGSMKFPRAYHSATALKGGVVVEIGGVGATTLGVMPVPVAEAYGPSIFPAPPGSGWHTTGTLHFPRYGHSATLLIDSRVLVVGGPKADPAELFNTVGALAGTFVVGATPAVPRIHHAAARLPSGDVVIAGGSGGAASATSEVWEHTVGTFTPAGKLINPHAACSAVVVPVSGKALLTGGAAAPGNVAAELFDPGPRTWSVPGNLTVARDGAHSETLLSSGHVLVAGGDSPATLSAELFDPCTGATCDDGNPCTHDLCDPSGACRHVAVSACGTPACSAPPASCTIADSDADGLPDTWETNGYVDVNCNGVNDGAAVDFQLPGVSATKPDVFVLYDWMDLADTGAPCPCAGATCNDAACIPGGATSSDLKCVPTSPGAATGTCRGHSHDPEALSLGALDKVVAQFALHGITLHLTRGQARPHSRVTSFETPHLSCEGADVSPGLVGDYAVNFYDLKRLVPWGPGAQFVYHYTVFAHYSSCDSLAHCGACTFVNPDGTVKATPFTFGETGIAELPGNDFIVSLGNLVNDLKIAPNPFIVGGTFMHELGHNLGLHHAGGSGASAEDTPNYKPNYLSVMNYRYQLSGIQAAAAVGSSTPDPTLQRLDYSNSSLPTAAALAGHLDETQLDETAGLGSGTSDLFTYFNGQCVPRIAASTGSVDWNGDGATTVTPVSGDLNPQEDPSRNCGDVTNEVFNGHTDWGPLPGATSFTWGFQCTSGYADGAPAPSARSPGELTPKMAIESHTLYPVRAAVAEVRPGCQTHALAARQAGSVSVAIYGQRGFDVTQIEPKSLRLQGARAETSTIADVNHDGLPDLSARFSLANLSIAPAAHEAVVSGWLQDSQLFSTTAKVTVVPTAGPLVEVRSNRDGYALTLGPATGQIVSFPAGRCVGSAIDRCGNPITLTNGNPRIVGIGWSDASSDAGPRDAQLSQVNPSIASLKQAALGPGRLYRILFAITDAEGNATLSSCNVGVQGANGALPPANAPLLSCVGECGLK